MDRVSGILGRVGRAWRSLAGEQRLAAVAALLLLLTLFLPWYGKSFYDPAKKAYADDSLTGFGSADFVMASVVLVGLGVLAMLFARGEGRGFHLPGGDGLIIMIAGGWAAFLDLLPRARPPGRLRPRGDDRDPVGDLRRLPRRGAARVRGLPDPLRAPAGAAAAARADAAGPAAAARRRDARVRRLRRRGAARAAPAWWSATATASGTGTGPRSARAAWTPRGPTTSRRSPARCPSTRPRPSACATAEQRSASTYRSSVPPPIWA